MFCDGRNFCSVASQGGIPTVAAIQHTHTHRHTHTHTCVLTALLSSHRCLPLPCAATKTEVLSSLSLSLSLSFVSLSFVSLSLSCYNQRTNDNHSFVRRERSVRAALATTTATILQHPPFLLNRPAGMEEEGRLLEQGGGGKSVCLHSQG